MTTNRSLAKNLTETAQRLKECVGKPVVPQGLMGVFHQNSHSVPLVELGDNHPFYMMSPRAQKEHRLMLRYTRGDESLDFTIHVEKGKVSAEMTGSDGSLHRVFGAQSFSYKPSNGWTIAQAEFTPNQPITYTGIHAPGR